MAITTAPSPAPAAPQGPAGSDGNVLAGLGLVALTPVLVLLANPPVGVWPLIFVAFVPMIVAQHRVLPARGEDGGEQRGGKPRSADAVHGDPQDSVRQERRLAVRTGRLAGVHDAVPIRRDRHRRPRRPRAGGGWQPT